MYSVRRTGAFWGQDSKGLPGRRNCVDKARREATACGIQADAMVEREWDEEGRREETGLEGSARLRVRGGGMCSGLSAGTAGLINDCWPAHWSPKWIPVPHVDP